MKTYVEIDHVQGGQPRPYADHEYVHVLTFTQDDGRRKDYLEANGLPLVRPLYVDEAKAHAIARIFCPYLDRTDPEANWASRFLVSFEKYDPTPYLVGEGTAYVETLLPGEGRSDRWKIHVRAAFTD